MGSGRNSGERRIGVEDSTKYRVDDSHVFLAVELVTALSV